jgi:uncharacterized protein (TIGR02001 family)
MIRCLFAVAVLLFGLSQTNAGEFSGYLTATTDYVKRGVSQSDSDPALQLGVDFSFNSGIYAGAWGSTIDLGFLPSEHLDSELNLYAGYAYDLSKQWRLSANVVSYEYPRQTSDIDYGYIEYSLAANYNDHFWLEYSYSPDVFGSQRSAENLEVYAEFTIRDNWSIGGGGGYYDISDLTGRGYGYWQLGVTGSFRFADIDFRFYDTNRPVYKISTDALARARIVVAVTIPF